MLALYNQLRMWLATREDGQDLVEYALLVAFIAIIAVVAVQAAGGSIQTLFQGVAESLGGVDTGIGE